MGKPKTQRTQDLHNAARRYVVGKQVEQAIEQHNFDRLIEQGVVVEDRTLSIKPVEITTWRLINWRDEGKA